MPLYGQFIRARLNLAQLKLQNMRSNLFTITSRNNNIFYVPHLIINFEMSVKESFNCKIKTEEYSIKQWADLAPPTYRPYHALGGRVEHHWIKHR